MSTNNRLHHPAILYNPRDELTLRLRASPLTAHRTGPASRGRGGQTRPRRVLWSHRLSGLTQIQYVQATVDKLTNEHSLSTQKDKVQRMIVLDSSCLKTSAAAHWAGSLYSEHAEECTAFFQPGHGLN